MKIISNGRRNKRMENDDMNPKNFGKNSFADLENADNHPSKDIKSSLGTEFKNKKIIVCITASVACYKSIDLIRLLMRHGAEVFVVISKAVEKFITRDYYLWASGNKVISELSGELEHVRLADYFKSDLIIVYPSTANTIGKFAQGIDDTPVTSVLSIALGSGIPIIIAPAMHEAMYNNKIIIDNIKNLEKLNVKFIKPTLEEGKAKIASPEEVLYNSIDILETENQNNFIDKENDKNDKVLTDFIKQSVDTVLHIKSKDLNNFFKNKKILISLGSTVEYIDPIRVVSNTSSGKMGLSLVRSALSMGFQVTAIKGLTSVELDPTKLGDTSNLIIHEALTSDQMSKVVLKEISASKYDVVILAAAVSDFKPITCFNNKISSDSKILNLTLIPTDKIIDKIKKFCDSTFLVAFKADYDVNEKVLLQKSYKKLVKSNANLVVANDVGMINAFIGSDQNKISIVDKHKNYYTFPIQPKDLVADNIFRVVYLTLNKNMNIKPS